MTLPPPPPAPPQNRPPLSDMNAWANFWYYERGMNVTPMVTKYKTGKKGYDYQIYQHKPVPEYLFAKWKAENAFADGIGLIISKVWRGPYKHPMKDTYLIFVDLDNQLAIDEFCAMYSNGRTMTLEDLSKKFLIEQHLDSPHKCHVYFYSDLSFPKKSSDVNKPGFDPKTMPSFEIKGLGGHGVAYCSPSIHQHGHPYQIIGTTEPTVMLSEEAAEDMIQRLDSICRKHNLHYLENVDSDGNRALIPMDELLKDDFKIHKDYNRHEALMRYIESRLKNRKKSKLTLTEIKQLAHFWNQQHCVPPLDDKEFEKQWKDAQKFIARKERKEQEQHTEQEQQEEQQETEQSSQQEEEQKQEPLKIELTEDLSRELTYEEVAVILSTSIKRDKAAKLISFGGMLLSQTNEDQINIGYQAESSAGKSWVPLEVAAYFPENEVREIAAASPTAFFHDSGQWDNERKALIVDLHHKILIFIDMPSYELLQRLRPMLSHDKPELRYMITDKSQKHGLRTKNVIIKGPPSVFFCTTKLDPDEQERTRMLLLSPETDQYKLRESIELAAQRNGNRRAYRKQIMEDPNRIWLVNRIYWIRRWGIREIILSDDSIKAVLERFKREHPYLQPRHQRDFPRIFSLIKVHALLNCFNREKVSDDTIRANETDIEAGFRLYKEIERSNELGLSLCPCHLPGCHTTTAPQID